MTPLFFLLLPITVWSAPDMCTALNATSFCMDSGFCSNTERRITCREAYIRASEGLLRFHSIPPIVSQLRRDINSYQSDLAYSRGEWRPPIPDDQSVLESIRTDPYHEPFHRALHEVSTLMQRDFPYIRNPPAIVFERLIRSARLLHIQSRAITNSPSYKSIVLNFKTVAVIVSSIRVYIEYLSALPRTDPLRMAIFANLLPFIHAWMHFQFFFKIEAPILSPEYFDFITSAIQYDPLDTSRDELKPWFITLPRMDPQTIVIPFVEPVPLAVFDFFDIPTDGLNITTVVERIANGVNSTNFQYQWISALFMQNHPDVTEAHKEFFCYTFRQQASGVLPFTPNPSRDIEMKMIAGITDLYRLCGDSVVPFEFRINRVLPRLFQRINITTDYSFDRKDEYELTTGIEIHFLRQNTRVFLNDLSGTSTENHIEYLSNFLTANSRSPIYHWLSSDEAFGPGPRRTLEFMGIAAGLLLIQGDPIGVLRRYYPTLKRDSFSFRNGFCKVINCVTFEALFSEHEIPRLLENIRTTLSS